MNPQCSSAALGKHRKVSPRLRSFDHAEGVFLSRHREIFRVVARYLKENT
jgi:hypothetical protein